jgi:hypothetical protein
MKKSAELKHPDPLVHLIDLTPPTTNNLLAGERGLLYANGILFSLSLPTLSLALVFAFLYYSHTGIRTQTGRYNTRVSGRGGC